VWNSLDEACCSWCWRSELGVAGGRWHNERREATSAWRYVGHRSESKIKGATGRLERWNTAGVQRSIRSYCGMRLIWVALRSS
jgi:hypothetical protein